jgi:membrane-associated phospholipid phosphatase
MRLCVFVAMLMILLPTARSSAQMNSQPLSTEVDPNTESEKGSTPVTENAPLSPEVKTREDQPAFLPPGEDPENRLFKPFLKHLVFDQRQFWTAPFHMDRQGAEVFLPFVAFSGGLIAGDTWISRQVPGSPSQINRSVNISDYATYSLIGAAGASYFWGHFAHNDHLRETGFLAGEAALNSTAAAYLFKTISQRPRPLADHGNGTFFYGGTSFPSEHSAIAWSVAGVIAHEYPGTLTKIAAYGLASAVTLTRVTGKQHFPSDVVVGSALGWYLGRQIYRTRHDPELGGAPWGNLRTDDDTEKAPRSPDSMGSAYVPLDSWVYPAIERLAAFGYVEAAFLGERPWTRIECAHLVEQAGEAVQQSEGSAGHLADLQIRLQEEFAYEFGLLDGARNKTVRLDSVYTRVVSISGPALTDSYHFGQTVSYDFGRPFERGMNAQAGGSFRAAIGPAAIFVRAEFQHSPSAPPLSDTVRNFIATADLVPVPAATPFNTINRPRLLDAYVAVNVKEGWQLSFGQQSLSWGPGPGGSFLWSNNSEPITMLRLMTPSAFRLPSFLGVLGPIRIDQFMGVLQGRTDHQHPWVYGQKISFKPLPCLEIGYARTTTIGGKGGDPFTTGNFFLSLFGQVSHKLNSVPGDTENEMDWTFHVPKVHKYIVLYGEVYAEDDFIAWVRPTAYPFRPGIYITHIPGIPKLDLHIEAANTQTPGWSYPNGSGSKGQVVYWNSRYRQANTNNGFLVGNTVGRMGQTIQGWLTYWASPRNAFQLSYKNNFVDPVFVPGGGAWQDYSVRNELQLTSGVYLKSQMQYEHISHYPILFSGSQRNVTAIIELGFLPHRVK